MSIIDTITDPTRLRGLSTKELRALAAEMRRIIVDTVQVNGGHLASNLGTVELAIALHRVFDSPGDAIVWDVGHQAYAHKLLTGRARDFPSLRMKDGISGFPKRAESPHDVFDSGHASTSISAALGILAAKRELSRADGKPRGNAIAVIGDGALTGGMAFEALSHAGQLGLPLIVVLNDNKMSISPAVGALSRYLSRLSGTVAYQKFRKRFDGMVGGIPLVGKGFMRFVIRFKKSLKALLFKENLFSDFGFEYVGPIDGHNITSLVQVLEEARAIERPVVVHAITRKGKGFDLAETDPAGYHGVTPGGARGHGRTEGERPTFTEAFSRSIMRLAAADGRVVAITAAMDAGTGLAAFRDAWPERFFDVGIAEEHAVTFAGGLAAAGLKPVVAIYSTFMQRSVDQVFHDVALQGLPVVFALDRAGAVPDDGETHQGIYDIALFRCLPGMRLLAPASERELDLMLEWALSRAGPTMLRYAKARCPEEREGHSLPLEEGRGAFVRGNGGAAAVIVAMGSLVEQALLAADSLESLGTAADVYDLRFLCPVDSGHFVRAMKGYDTVVFLEEGVATGGVCNDLARLLEHDDPSRKVAVRGFDSNPLPHARRDELLELAGLSAARVAECVLALREGDHP